MYKRIIYLGSPFTLILLLNYTWSSSAAYTLHTSSILGPSDHREAYFNGSAYVRLLTTISLQRHTGLNFRTCVGGELFSQQYNENIVALSVTKNGLEFMASTANKRYETVLVSHLLDNRWHTVSLEYRLGNLTLAVDGQTQMIANKSFNSDLLTNPGLSNEGAILIVGKQFSGCILEGPSIVFNTSFIHPHDTFFGPCPLPTNSCIPRTDMVKTRTEDYCYHEPCMRHGICVSRPDKYECHCTPRYSGNNCEIDIGSPCKINQPCINGATCIEDKQGDYKCSCIPGYTGKHCESEIIIHPLCDPDPCLNNGTCRVLPGANSPDCVCSPGFKGSKCEIDINNCQLNPCENGGTCIDGPNNYTCYCAHTGYQGVNCDININECVNNPCLNQGVCFDTYGSYICQCQDGFDGQNCEQNLNECVSMPCQNRGTCIDRVGGYECMCPSSYSGVHCELSACDGTTCPSYAECIETASGFRCVCKPGYSGKHCQLNIDECISMPCLNGGTCIDRVNGFVCNCTDEYIGAICEHPYEACELKPCKNNATCTTSANKHDFTCECPAGFDGPTCENNINECLHASCPEGRVCVDLVANYDCRCPEGFTGDNCSLLIDPCSKTYCQNGATCIINAPHSFSCNCSKGFTGRFCEEDIDECATTGVPICTHGICVNKHGGFQCYCMPGYTGETCSLDFDECLSQPCKNNATCLNKINNYECVCTPGYTGKDCSIDINECETSPCMAGSTCIDGIASFKCICQPGMTGRLCQINIDDCESGPCQNGGQCLDGLNSYACNCSDTGYSGIHCEMNIDDCLSNPCTNGAQCIDGIKDYTCSCYAGYNGKNCEMDINECESAPCQYSGTCLQRSNMSLYHFSSASMLNISLPIIYAQPFNYANASGYECVCVAGVVGKDCEININECESSPCRGGTCNDKIGGYICECDEGYEGEHCEHDIDECLKYTPCVHGTCMDRKANYYCDCLPHYGGKNCSVELIGCQENPCLNNGTCKPYLENEIHHKFNCSCPNGFHGDTCEKITTMSLSGSSYVAVNTSRDEGYDIQFRFKTTLGDGLLAIGKGLTYYILELVHGRLNLHSSLLNKWEGVFIGSGLNDSNWQKVFVAINSSHLVLAANEEQTIYPINLNEGSNASHTSFPTTYLGGTISELRRLTHGPPSFVGCTEDVIINGEWVLPQNTSWMSLVDIEVGCLRTPQCNPNPCHSEGRCTDKWRAFSCTCERPYLGHTCQYNYTAATFGYENIANSLVTVAVTDAAKRAVRSIVDISMFVRTRQSTGQIFYMGSTLSATNYNDDTYISAQLEGGELLVRILFNGTPEYYTVGGVKLDNGYNHLIEVIRNVTLVQVKLNGTEYFRKTISATGQLDAQVLYLGGLPEIVRPVRQTDISGLRMDTTTSSGPAAIVSTSSVSFKGIIQDVQISNGSRRMVVEFFPLKVQDLDIPLAFGNVTFDETTLKEGVVSDDSCLSDPCDHNGTCTVTWNDFRCQCPRGFKGKTCSDLEFCQLKECPAGSNCRNLEDGYECIANTTFNGKTNPLTYNLNIIQPLEIQTVYESMEINYRTKYGGTLLFVQSEEDYFFIFVNKDQITAQWSLLGRPESYRFSKDNIDGGWNTLYFVIKDRVFYGGFKELVDDDTANFATNDFNASSFTSLFMRGTVYLGGSDKKSYDFLNLHDHYKRFNTTNYVSNSSVTEATIEIPMNALQTEIPFKNKAKDKFKGCLGEIRIGNLLLPYFMTDKIYSTNYTAVEYFSLRPKSDPDIGCRLCYEEDCLNRGHCLNAEASYQCYCAPGYTSEDCSVDIDECMDNKCQNNSTCIDGIANFTCVCLTGYEGWYCDEEVDECRSNPCRNGGSCTDLLANYTCSCTEDYVGHQCEAHRLVTCENQPCHNGSTCADGPNAKTGNNFTCNCIKGMVGALCDTAFCIADPCRHGNCNITAIEPFCQCERGYSGTYCEVDIDDCVLPTGDSPCQNNGLCLDEVYSFSCNCTGTGYKGLICEIDVDECESEFICGNEGKCQNTVGSYRCSCPQGMCGLYCGLVDPCLNNNCVRGKCISICNIKSLFNCECEEGFYGTYCNETVVEQSASSNAVNIALIVVPIVAILLLGGAVGLAILVAMARSKRATRGTYSPSAQEFCNPRVELDHVLKPPPEERLI